MKKLNYALVISFLLMLISGCSEMDLQPDLPDSNDETVLKSGKKHPVPFKASFEIKNVNPVIDKGILTQTVVGIGQASHLGKTTVNNEETIDVSTEPPWTGKFKITFTAANGDQLFSEFNNCTLTPLSPTEFDIWAEGSITGGTGRFENASGELVKIATFIFNEPGNPLGTGESSYSGEIMY